MFFVVKCILVENCGSIKNNFKIYLLPVTVQVDLVVSDNACFVFPAIAKPDRQKKWNTDVSGDHGGQVDLIGYEGFIILPERNEQAQTKASSGPNGKNSAR